MDELRRNISQSKMYVLEFLKRFDMLECKSMATDMDMSLKLMANKSS